MAKFKRKTRTSRFRGFLKRSLRTRHGIKPESVIIPAVIYGAGRQYLVNMARPLTSKIPLGNYADEAVFGVAGYMLAKKGKGIVKQLGLAALTIEAASLGNQLVGTIGGNNGAGSW